MPAGPASVGRTSTSRLQTGAAPTGERVARVRRYRPGTTGAPAVLRRSQLAVIRLVAVPERTRDGVLPHPGVTVRVQVCRVGTVAVTVIPGAAVLPDQVAFTAETAGATRPGAIRAATWRRSDGRSA